MADIIPVNVPESLLQKKLSQTGINPLSAGETVEITGQFRSYNKIIGDRSKLILSVFARDITVKNKNAEINTPNSIELTGFICKIPIYRTTPFNREIADILIAVNRDFNKSDYIPAIAWGRNARFAKNLLIGEKISITGRIQSREYQKKLDDGSAETRIAYEISINTIVRAETRDM
jgi:hypothetical protein